MEQNTNELIQERFSKLPKEVQDAIVSTQTQEMVQAIGKKYRLHVDQLGKLQTEMLLIMLGLEQASDFTENIKDGLSVSEQDAASIAIEINTQVFAPIRAALHQVYERDVTEAEEASELTEVSSLEDTQLGSMAKPLPDTVLSQKISSGQTTEEQTKLPHTRPPRSNPPQTIEKKSPAEIAEVKLSSKAQALPTEERVVDEDVLTKPPYKGVDPYREPV